MSLFPILLGSIHSLLFVLSFHISSPSSLRMLPRNNPLVIKHRIKSVISVSMISILLTIIILRFRNGITFIHVLKLMGIFVGPVTIMRSIICSLSLTITLFTGPLIYYAQSITNHSQLEKPHLQFYRNYVIVSFYF